MDLLVLSPATNERNAEVNVPLLIFSPTFGTTNLGLTNLRYRFPHQLPCFELDRVGIQNAYPPESQTGIQSTPHSGKAV